MNVTTTIFVFMYNFLNAFIKKQIPVKNVDLYIILLNCMFLKILFWTYRLFLQ